MNFAESLSDALVESTHISNKGVALALNLGFDLALSALESGVVWALSSILGCSYECSDGCMSVDVQCLLDELF